MPKSTKRRSRAAAVPKAVPLRRRATKISITVDEAVLRAMEQEAERSGRTLSAEVSEALAQELRRRRLQELIAEYEAAHGVITAQELASIEAK